MIPGDPLSKSGKWRFIRISYKKCTGPSGGRGFRILKICILYTPLKFNVAAIPKRKLSRLSQPSFFRGATRWKKTGVLESRTRFCWVPLLLSVFFFEDVFEERRIPHLIPWISHQHAIAPQVFFFFFSGSAPLGRFGVKTCIISSKMIDDFNPDLLESPYTSTQDGALFNKWRL